MTDYAIGDIQGCFSALKKLLEQIHFNPQNDRIYFVGDLVNRGDQSLEVLRFVKNLGDSAICVLGNHDLHLLAVFHGYREAGRKDTLDSILQAPDAPDLLDWLRRQPLLHHDVEHNILLVHAGIHPHWSLSTALQEARFAEYQLQSDEYPKLLETMFGNKPARWKPGRNSIKKRLRFAINCFTRMRYCQSNGKMDFNYKNTPGTQPEELMPWFELPRTPPSEVTLLDLEQRFPDIVFGHWSTVGNVNKKGIYALDTGCLWGGQLTALELGNRRIHRLQCEQQIAPS